MRSVSQILLFLALLSGLGGSLLAQTRVALVIGNSAYENTTFLANPKNDASLIVAALQRSGFGAGDIVRVTDASKRQMDAALSEFARRAATAEVALVFYAGHGIEIGGRNYLLPVDTVLKRDEDIDSEAIELDQVLNAGKGARLRLIVLDACRNNPLNTAMKQRLRFQAVGQGLAEVEPDTDALVVYSTRAGSVALDGDQNNSPFATSFARRLAEPGLEIGMMFRAVRDDVLKATGRQQEPFTFGAFPGRAFYLVPPATPISSEAAVQIEALTWQGALAAQSKGGFETYLNRYPNGMFAALARENLNRLSSATPVQAIKPKFTAPLRPPVPRTSAPVAVRPVPLPSAAAIRNAYAREIAGQCRLVTADRYPFYGSASAEVSVSDFVRLFASDGVIDRFAKRNVLPNVDTNGDYWIWRSDKPSARQFDPAVASEFQKASDIRDVFAEGFTLTATGTRFKGEADEAELVVGDYAVRFKDGQMGPLPVIWSINGSKAKASLTLFSGGAVVKRYAFDGPWSLFRLVDVSRRETVGPRAFRATFGDPQASFTLKIDIPFDQNPFSRGGIWSFRCPSAL